MKVLIDLAFLLALLTAPMFSAWQGENYGKHDAERGAKGAATASAIVLAYGIYRKTNREADHGR